MMTIHAVRLSKPEAAVEVAGGQMSRFQEMSPQPGDFICAWA